MNGPAKLIAGIVALTGFVVAAVAGLAAGNAAETTLLRCILAMFTCYLAGLPLGMICEHVIDEHLKDFISKNPIPKPGALETQRAANASSPNVEGSKFNV